MVHAHGQNVVGFETNQRRQDTFEAGVAVRPAPDEMTIDPNLGIVIDAIKFNRNQLVGLGGIDLEMFSIPSDAARGIAISASELGAKGAIAAPVMRQVNVLPGRIVKAWRH